MPKQFQLFCVISFTPIAEIVFVNLIVEVGKNLARRAPPAQEINTLYLRNGFTDFL